jgi:putative DNA primase/helicase
VLEIARAYVAAGLSLVPILRDGTKAAAVSWACYQDRLPTDAELRSWFDRREPLGVATVGGRVSGGLEQIDFDKDADELFPAWQDLVEADSPGLTARLCVLRTPRPGWRVAYRVPGLDPFPGSLKLTEERFVDQGSGKTKRRTLIETRGKGGYAIVPGTPAECHKTGRLYEHVRGPQLTSLAALTPGERGILIRCAASLTRAGEEEPLGKGSSPKVYATGASGTEYNTRGPDWSAILEPHGWECVRTCGQRRYWRRPGKEDRGWSATTGHCRNKDGHELLAVFSSDADPFPGPSGGRLCSCHTRFGAYGLLAHASDFSAAAKELARLGYGSPGSPGPSDPPEDSPPVAAEQLTRIVLDVLRSNRSLARSLNDILTEARDGTANGPL